MLWKNYQLYSRCSDLKKNKKNSCSDNVVEFGKNHIHVLSEMGVYSGKPEYTRHYSTLRNHLNLACFLLSGQDYRNYTLGKVVMKEKN